MNYAKLIFIFGIFIASITFAKGAEGKKLSRKPNQVENKTMRLKVVYGEKTTVFLVSKSKNGGYVHFSNNLGTQDGKPINSADFDFLSSKVASFQEPTNLKEFCSRNYIELKSDGRELLGCLGAPNKLAEGMQELTNLLSALF